MVSVEPPCAVLCVGRVLDRGADDALVVDALVLVEALVLDRHRRLLEDLRELVRGDGRDQVVVLDEAEARLPSAARTSVSAPGLRFLSEDSAGAVRPSCRPSRPRPRPRHRAEQQEEEASTNQRPGPTPLRRRLIGRNDSRAAVLVRSKASFVLRLRKLTSDDSNSPSSRSRRRHSRRSAASLPARARAAARGRNRRRAACPTGPPRRP